MAIGVVSLAFMSFWLRSIIAIAVGAGVLLPIAASGAPSLSSVQAKVRQLEEEATSAAEGAQEAKVKLAGLNKTLDGIKAKAQLQGQTVSPPLLPIIMQQQRLLLISTIVVMFMLHVAQIPPLLLFLQAT